MESKSRIDPVFFLDRTHGKSTWQLLQAVRTKVILHHKWFLAETPDPEWIAKCGQEDWVVLSGDKSIETVPENRQAVIDARCKVFFFNDTNSLGEEWAAAFIVGRPKLYEIIERNNGPFFVTLQKHCRTHVSSVRFVGSGGPKPAESEAQIAVAEKPIAESPFIEPRQYVLPTMRRE